MENKEVMVEEVREMEETELKHWKIGEIYVVEDETKPDDANGSLVFVLGDGLSNEINKKGNEDLKERMVAIVTAMHELLIDVQIREKENK